MGRISARCSTCATTSMVSLMLPHDSKIDVTAASDLAVILRWPVASGAAARCSSRSPVGPRGRRPRAPTACPPLPQHEQHEQQLGSHSRRPRPYDEAHPRAPAANPRAAPVNQTRQMAPSDARSSLAHLTHGNPAASARGPHTPTPRFPTANQSLTAATRPARNRGRPAED
eukprot:7376666-Prymnesium_polylepis.1